MLPSKLIKIFLLVLCIILVGIIGFQIIESLTLIDALYMTVITISTVGFGEVQLLSDTGKIFTIILILGGIAVITTGVSMIFSSVLEGTFAVTLRRQRMEKKLKKIKDHFIICGFGHVGHDVITEFMRAREKFILIEKDEERLIDLKSTLPDLMYVVGDATDDDVLRRGGIETARGIIAVLGSDSDNLYICLSARTINPKLRIIARVVEGASISKLQKAGADYVFSPETIGGVQLAAAALKPTVTSFLDTILKGEYYGLMLDEVPVQHHSSLIDKTLQEAEISRSIGIVIPAIQSKQQQKLIFNPGPTTKMSQGDVLIVFGTPEQITLLRDLCGSDIPGRMAKKM